MKIRWFIGLVCCLSNFCLYAQSNTEVYLFDLNLNDGKPQLSNPKNISDNNGYDNQPSFWGDDTVLFASTRAGQTDILQFSIKEGSTTKWLTNTPAGSEYSPLKIPNKNSFSAVRLDLDGLQRLYEYQLSGESTMLSELKIGYHVWFNPTMLVATVLVENRMDLVVIDLKEDAHTTIVRNVGRSLHKIPGTNSISYIDKNKNEWAVGALDMLTMETEVLVNTYKNEEDIYWLDKSTLITGYQNSLLTYDITKNESWDTLFSFEPEEINNITRIAINPSRTRLAFVAEESPSAIVQRQVTAFNSQNLDAFISLYSDDVVVKRFPNQLMYKGKDKMLDNYERFFKNVKSSNVKVVNRITLGNTVIDEEITKVDERIGRQVAIYQIENGLISSMTFIFPEGALTDAESIVQEQLEAYNARDIDAFLDTYANNIQLLNYPNKLNVTGKKSMRAQYGSFFESTPNLHCEIKNRIVVGNKIIDEEYVTVNGNHISAIAIYVVENGKIAKVTFIQ